MVKDIIITINVNKKTIKTNKTVLGVVGENLQGNFIVEFEDEFIDGACWLETKCENEKGYISLTKDNETYIAPIKSSLTQIAGDRCFQVRIIQGESENEVPVFKSEMFTLKVLEGVNALDEVVEPYPEFVDVVEGKLANKVGKDEVYSKTETDNKLNDKANVNEVYNKTETDNKLSEKTNKNEVYSKEETDNKLNEKVNLTDAPYEFAESEYEKCLNLFSFENAMNISNIGTVYEHKENYIKVATGANNAFVWVTYVCLDLRKYAGKTLYLKANYKTSSSNIAKVTAWLTDVTGNQLSQIISYPENGFTGIGTTASTIQVPNTFEEGIYYLSLLFYGDVGGGLANDYCEYTNVMLSKVNVDYLPYNGEIVRRKDIAPAKWWENASPNSSFAGQQINKSLANVKSVEIYAKYYAPLESMAWQKFEFIRGTSNISTGFISIIENTTIFNRKVNIDWSNGYISFDNGKFNGTDDNDRMVPVLINARY